MHVPEPSSPIARRELVLVATILVGLARLVDLSDAFLVAGLLPIAILVAGSAIIGGDEAPTRPYESLLLPAVLAGGSAAAIHLVPAGVWVAVALLAFALLLDRVVALEMRLLAQPGGVTDVDRSRVMLYAVATAFVAFTGMATLVPGGLAEPGGSTTAGSSSLSEAWLLVLALDDALVALLLGYRVAALRYGSTREAARSALTYAIVIAIAAGAIRAIDLPRLVGPAILTLVFYLWDAQHGSAPARRREPRFLWEMILLGVLAVVVIAWNMRLHG
jgi:hypothetical protein